MKRVLPPAGINGYSLGGYSQELLLLLAEELKQPLVAISQLAELQDDGGLQSLAHASRALKTIDNITLYHRINSGQMSLRMEPVHVGSTIAEVAHSMESIMKSAGCHTELVIQHGLSPVTADRRLLISALQSLWQGFLSTMPEGSFVECRARKTPLGVRLSLHGKNALISEIKFSNTNLSSSQPIAGLAGSSADIITARGMFALLGAELSKSSTKQIAGIGATLRISHQLQMV